VPLDLTLDHCDAFVHDRLDLQGHGAGVGQRDRAADMKAPDQDIVHPFALEGMSEVTGARELVTLHPHQGHHDTLVR
jgi:hypothetical protein